MSAFFVFGFEVDVEINSISFDVNARLQPVRPPLLMSLLPGLKVNQPINLSQRVQVSQHESLIHFFASSISPYILFDSVGCLSSI